MLRAIMTDMQPQNFENTGAPEQLPVQPPNNNERIPVLPTPETGVQQGAERREQAGEARAAVADAAGAAQPAVPAIDDTSTSASDPATSSQSASPIVAADQDVIEKEWVDKAKKIVMETQDDPHKRQVEVSELQKDYLQKRYGKQLGAKQ